MAVKPTATPKRTRSAAQAKAIAEHPLADLIPDASFAEGYINRIMDDGLTDFEVLYFAMQNGKNIMTFGDTGTGKTTMFMAFAAAYGLPIVTVQGNGGIDPNTFWGSYQFDPVTGQPAWVDSDITRAIRHGDAIIYVDESNYMPPKVLGAWNSLTDFRRFITILENGNVHVQAGPNLLIVTSFNPDYEGTRRLNKAFKNRWPIKMEIDYDQKIEAEKVYMPVVLEIANQLRESRKAGNLDTPISTNMLTEFEDLAAELGLNFAVTNFINAFDVDERESVKNAFEMNMDTLKAQRDEMLGLNDPA